MCTRIVITVCCIGVSLHGQDSKVVLPKDSLPKDLDLAPQKLGLDLSPNTPADNPMTRERVELGRRLFFDPILSKDNTVSCASCHQPDHGFASPDRKAIGIAGQEGTRNSPTVLNRVYGRHFFWDGRAASLEEQALMPIENPKEFNTTVKAVLQKIRQQDSYVREFEKAFSTADGISVEAQEFVTAKNLAKAIASFQRVLVIGDSPIDRFQAGEYKAITTKQRQGLWIFESRGGCWKCHSGGNYSDEKFHNTGVSFKQSERDAGRYDHTKDENDIGKFKTPTLRGVAQTAPFMHDGSVKTLKEVVEFYNLGGSPKDPRLDSKIKPLGLTENEIDALVAFLEALSTE